MTYRVAILPAAFKQLAELPKPDQRRVQEAIDALASDPRPPGAKSLQGKSKGLHRIRVGNYRIVYRIRQSQLLVLVVRIGHRGSVYRGM